jgi:hypothetical protein
VGSSAHSIFGRSDKHKHLLNPAAGRNGIIRAQKRHLEHFDSSRISKARAVDPEAVVFSIDQPEIASIVTISVHTSL